MSAARRDRNGLTPEQRLRWLADIRRARADAGRAAYDRGPCMRQLHRPGR